MSMPTNATPQHIAPVPGAGIEQWCLDPAITYLNHGSFGARLRVVAEAQRAWSDQFETRPIETLDRKRDALLGHALDVVGKIVGARSCDLGFVTNATGGVNAVLRSIDIKPGDELLTTDHVYNAVRNTMRYVAEANGGSYVEVKVPLPVSNSEEIVTAICAAMTDKTRLLVIDHISSPTAILFPVERIIEEATARGVDVLVDGAHAPGMIDLNIESLNPAYYTANLHKWLCAPVGAAFLRVRPDKQEGIHPNTISHFIGEGLGREFSWQGTRDISAWCCSTDAIHAMEAFGLQNVMAHNHAMAVWVQELLCTRWNVVPATPGDGSLIGSMTAVPLPAGARRFGTPEAIQALLYNEHAIEVPIIDWGGQWWCRASCQVYNEAAQYERLASAVLCVCEP